MTWKGWWDDEDSSEVLEHGDFLVDAWQPEGQPKYTRQWLQQEFTAGRTRELCLFWGHQPSEDGQLTKSCLSQCGWRISGPLPIPIFVWSSI